MKFPFSSPWMKPLSVKNCTASFAHDEMLPASLNSAADATGTIADATSAAVAVVAKKFTTFVMFRHLYIPPEFK
ncbi:hypothetical protein OL548_14620 [Lysinibacillus sp. MHQ-1]|nr:hypothetical protein OL548_14620 [Lysinibacillus sp. MHQ-1]